MDDIDKRIKNTLKYKSLVLSLYGSILKYEILKSWHLSDAILDTCHTKINLIKKELEQYVESFKQGAEA